MKKLYFLLVASCLALSTMATTFTFTSAEDINQDMDNILLELGKGGNSAQPAYSDYSKEMRLYIKNTITLVSLEPMTDIQLVFSRNADNNKPYASLSADCGTLVSGGESTGNKDWKIDKWTGNATMVVFTLGSESKAQRNIREIVVNGAPIVITPDSQEVYIDTTALDQNYTYAEPTIVGIPNKNFYKQEYAFIDNNIRISCTKGSILNDTVTYFNCNANEQMTIEAAKSMKGIVIYGEVRKEFTATCDKGNMTYLSPDEFYPEDYQICEHALIIKDIDSNSVTISCAKQFRCYTISVYFNENPTATMDCDDEETNIEAIYPPLNPKAAMYDVLGRRVNKDYHGIIIQEGHKYIVR